MLDFEGDIFLMKTTRIRLATTTLVLAAITSCLGLVAMALSSAAQTETVRLSAFINGKPAGEGTVTRTVLPGGLQKLHTLLKVKQSGQNLEIDLTTTTDAKGAPTDKVLKIAAGAARATTVTMKINDQGATMSIVGGPTHKLALPKGTTRADPSNWWFVRTQPKVGQTATYQSLEPFEMEWRATTVKYVGERSITIAGEKVQAHYLTQVRGGKTSNIYLDKRGMPLRIEEPSLTLVRQK